MDNVKHKIKGQKKFFLMTTVILLGIGIYIGFIFQSTEKHKAVDIVVYKSPTCGCCNKWVKHLEKAGFTVKAINERDMNAVKNKLGVNRSFQSCHTAKIANYFIEGHVPAADIKKLLTEKPDAKGLAVPGMPMGSPGMEGQRKDQYSVLLINKQNKALVYNQY